MVKKHKDYAQDDGQPDAAVPEHLELLFETTSDILLKIQVSDPTDISGYGFAYAGVAVKMSLGQGHFNAKKGVQGRLEWVMVGNPGGHMKVTVTRDGKAIRERPASTIPAPKKKAWDRFDLQVS